MNLRADAKAQFSILKNGLLLTFVIVMILYLFHWVWGFVLSLGYNPFSSNLANFSIKILFFLISAYIVGRAFENNTFKQIIFDLHGKLPIVGSLVESLNHFDRIKSEGAPEVLFEFAPNSGIWLKGWVSKEWKDKKSGKTMCGGVLPMFVHPIGAYSCIEKEKLIYTGRQALETIADCLSGGLISGK
jgi:hypothetical protein